MGGQDLTLEGIVNTPTVIAGNIPVLEFGIDGANVRILCPEIIPLNVNDNAMVTYTPVWNSTTGKVAYEALTVKKWDPTAKTWKVLYRPILGMPMQSPNDAGSDSTHQDGAAAQDNIFYRDKALTIFKDREAVAGNAQFLLSKLEYAILTLIIGKSCDYGRASLGELKSAPELQNYAIKEVAEMVKELQDKVNSAAGYKMLQSEGKKCWFEPQGVVSAAIPGFATIYQDSSLVVTSYGIFNNNSRVPLTERERKLLELMVSKKPDSKEYTNVGYGEIQQKLLGREDSHQSRMMISITVNSLNRKLDGSLTDLRAQWYIQNIRDVGYQFAPKGKVIVAPYLR